MESLEGRRLLATDIAGTGGSIADNTTTEFKIEEVQALNIADLNITLDIEHNRAADLDIYLKSPDNIRVKLFDDVGGSGDNFTDTVLDDEASSSITSGSAPFTGSYRPEGSLTVFDGARPSGTWTLEVTDDRRRTAGTLNSWSLQVEEAGAEISIGDATADEAGDHMRYLQTMVTSGSGGQAHSRSANFGPDGNLYLTNIVTLNDGSSAGYVNRFDSNSGEFLDEFASHPLMTGAKDHEFGPDGHLYVTNNLGHNVLKFDGGTGEFISEFVSASAGLLTPRSLTFGPDISGDSYPDLYVASAQTDSVVAFNGSTGALLGDYVAPGSGGLNSPTALVFDTDGNLYVASGAHDDFYNSIRKYASFTGALPATSMGDFVPAGGGGLTLAPTAGVIFGPDFNNDGQDDLYVSNGVIDEVLVYDGTNGDLIGDLIASGEGGLDDPKGLVFDDDGTLLVVGGVDNDVKRFNIASQAGFVVSLNSPQETAVTVDFATSNGTAIAGQDYQAQSGTLTFNPGEVTKFVFVDSIDNDDPELTETFEVQLSNPSSGVSLANDTGTATQYDDDASYITISDDASKEGGQQAKVLDTFVTEDSGGLTRPRAGAFGPDGNFYVVSADTDEILRYDGSTGAFIDVFVNSDGNDLDDPLHLAFSLTDNYLYVSSLGTQNKVFRFNATTGAYIDVPVTSATFPMGMTVDADGNLYVADRDADAILKFDGTNVTTFIDSSSGLDGPRHVELGPSFDGSVDDDLYVASTGNKKILAYRTNNGSLAGEFATVPFYDGPMWLDFDSSGDLYAVGRPTSQCCDVNLIRYTSGGSEVTTSLDADGWSFVVGPDDLIYQSGNGNGDYVRRLTETSNAVFTVSLSQPSDAPITVSFTTQDGSATGGVDNTDDFEAMSGTLTFAPGETSKTVIVPTFNDSTSESDETFSVLILNPTGDGLILDDTGESTISDDDSNNPNALYVDDIYFQSGNGNRYRAVFVVRRDSNASGTADAGDVVVSGVSMTVTFGGTTFTGTTDSNGVFRTNWVKNLGGGNHYANVVDMALSGYVYDPLDLDKEDDSDGDGKADDVLTL